MNSVLLHIQAEPQKLLGLLVLECGRRKRDGNSDVVYLGEIQSQPWLSVGREGLEIG